MSETSLFAELVKDRNMRELAMKRLAALTDKSDEPILVEETSQENNQPSSQEETTSTPPPPTVNVDDIPVPKMESPPLPPTGKGVPGPYPLAMDPMSFLPHGMVPPPNMLLPPTSKTDSLIMSALNNQISESFVPCETLLEIVNSVNRTSEPVKKEIIVGVKNELEPVKKSLLVTKPKSLTKLPMPPGIDQTDLESIDSPPSKSPSPVREKTPPKKGIKDLPLPPG